MGSLQTISVTSEDGVEGAKGRSKLVLIVAGVVVLAGAIAGIVVGTSAGGKSSDPCSGIDTSAAVTINLEPNWGDYSTCSGDTGSTCTGIVSPLVTAVCAAAGLTCTQSVVEWSTIWDGSIGSGFSDGSVQIAAGARNTGPRQDECMAFSNPYTVPGVGVVLATAAIETTPPAKGASATFCSLTGWAVGTDYLNEAPTKQTGVFSMNYDITVVEHLDFAALLAAHADGTCHYSLVEPGAVDGGSLKEIETITAADHRVGGVSFMADGTDPNTECLISKLNTGLAVVRKSGDLTALAAGKSVDAVELTAEVTNSDTCTRPGPCDGIDTSAAVTINLEPNWGDYSTCSGDTGSTCTGIVSPLVTAVCAAAGLTCTQSVVEWSTIWDGSIGSGFSDGSVQIAAGARNTGPRQDECMAFSNPYTVPGVGVVLATAAIETTPPAKGASATFCSLTGWAVGTDYLNEAPTKQTGVFSMNYDITVVEHLDFAALLAAHADGTCHYSLVEPGAVDGGSLKEIETITAADHRVGGVSFMADGTDPNTECLISKLNTGLAVVRKSGDLTALAAGKSVDAVELTAEVTNSDTCTRPGPCDGIDTSAAVTINLEPNWGDYSTCSGDTGSTCTGIVSPLVTAVCAAAGLTCTQSVVEWSTIWDGSIGSGFSDGSVQIAAGARNTGPRQDECMAFSNPYTVPGVGVVLATAAIETTPPAKGASATFCSLTGWAVGTDYLNEAPTKQTGVFSMNYDITVVEHLDFAALLAAHADGTCHYSLVEPGAVDGGSLKEIETITAADHRVGGVSFMADGTDPNTECLISKLNTGLAVVRKSGDLTALAVGKSVDAVELTAEVTNSDTCTRPGPCDGIDTSAAVTINLEPNWGDYSTCSGDTGSTCTGIVSPLVTAVCAAAGLTCTQSVVEWSTIWDGSIGSGFSDGSVQIAAGARNTGPRQDECMAFSNPYTVPGVGVVLATAAIETTPPAKGASATFCSLTGWAVGTDYLNEAPTKQTGVFSMNYDITVVEHLDFAALLAAHADGTCHYSLVEPGAVDGGSLKEIETITAADHRVGGVSFMADGTDPNTECLISKLNTGLAVVRKSGDLTALAVGKSVDAVELTAEVTNSDTCTRPGPCDGIDTSAAVTINLEPNWGDYSTCSGDTGSTCTGIVSPLVTAVCAAAGLTCTQSVVEWSTIWDGSIGSGFSDGSVQIAAGARNTGPRQDECMAFSNPYTVPGVGVVLATAAIETTPPAKGASATFCSLTGWAVGTDYLNEAPTKQTGVFSMNYDITVVEHLDFAALLAAHADGTCHYSLVEPGAVDGGSLKEIETITAADHRVGGVSFMADGTDPNTECLISKLNTGLAVVRKNGELTALAVGKSVDAVELTAEVTNSDTCTRPGPTLNLEN